MFPPPPHHPILSHAKQEIKVYYIPVCVFMYIMDALLLHYAFVCLLYIFCHVLVCASVWVNVFLSAVCAYVYLCTFRACVCVCMRSLVCTSPSWFIIAMV